MLQLDRRGKVKKRLDKSEYVHLAPTRLDQRIRVNHENCPAGTDRRKRLEISNRGDRILAYCHHCGCSGVHRLSLATGYKNRVPSRLRGIVGINKEQTGIPVGGKPTSLPPASVLLLGRKRLLDPLPSIHELPPSKVRPLQAYLNKYHLDVTDLTTSRSDLSNYGHYLGWDPDRKVLYTTTDSLYSPVVTQSHRYQCRSLDPDYKGPRWMAHGTKGIVGITPYRSTTHPRVIVVVEDMISMLRVVQCGFGAICTFGSQITPDQMIDIKLFLARNGVDVRNRVDSGIFVYYDDDNPTVRRHSIETMENLRAMFNPRFSGVISTGRDPKNELPADLSNILEERFNLELYKEKTAKKET